MAASTRFFAVLALALVASASAAKAPPFASVAEAATKTKNLSTLLTLVVKANLTAALGPEFKGIVFAPTNKAFAALPKATVEAVTADIALLTKVLTYHASSTIAKRSLFADSATIPTLAGQNVTLGKTGVSLTVKGAGNATPSRISKRVRAGKANIYLINSVLLPK